ncbi:MAG: hypothetical protein PVJ21_03725 [Anaerolineales bacterium]|jgi:hypothetical protein
MKKLEQFPDHDLNDLRYGAKKEEYPLKAWRWLMAMTEYEIHHCSQLAAHLSLMGVQPPSYLWFGRGRSDRNLGYLIMEKEIYESNA